MKQAAAVGKQQVRKPAAQGHGFQEFWGGIRGTVTRGPLQVLLGDLEMCGGRTAHGEKIGEIALGAGVTQLNFKGQSGKGNDNGKFLPSVVEMWRLEW